MQKICYLKIACRNGIICLIFYRLRYINRENIAKCLENIQCFLMFRKHLQTFFLGHTLYVQVKWSLLLGRRRTDVSAYRLQDGLSQGPRGFGINVQ